VLFRSTDAPIVTHPRNLIVLDEDSQAVIVDQWLYLLPKISVNLAVVVPAADGTK